LNTIKVAVDIEHTYIGDLVVSIRPPTSMGVAPITLHSREGGPADNIKKTYYEVNTPGLVALKNKSLQGTEYSLLKTGSVRTQGRLEASP
jgi:subtilisin-like proprotein convertase family protein